MSDLKKNLPVFYTVKEFREIFNISEPTFWRWRKKGKFITHSVGHRAIISEGEVNRLLSQST